MCLVCFFTMAVFCDAKPYSLVEIDLRLRGAYCPHHQDEDSRRLLLHTCRRKNLNSPKSFLVPFLRMSANFVKLLKLLIFQCYITCKSGNNFVTLSVLLFSCTISNIFYLKPTFINTEVV